jgi:hypothetical protein
MNSLFDYWFILGSFSILCNQKLLAPPYFALASTRLLRLHKIFALLIFGIFDAFSFLSKRLNHNRPSHQLTLYYRLLHMVFNMLKIIYDNRNLMLWVHAGFMMGLWWVPVWCLFLLGFEPCLPCLGSKVNGDTEFPHQALDSYTEALQVVPGKSQVRPVFPGWHMSSSDRMKFRNVRNAELSSSWLHGQHKPVVVVTRGDSWWLEVAKAPHPSDLGLTVTSCSRQPRREGNRTWMDVPWRYAQRSTIRQWLIHTDTE